VEFRELEQRWELEQQRRSRREPRHDNGHFERQVNLAPLTDWQIDEVHVCTEISDDAVHFESVNCKTRFLG
jgi:hypothetical protein